MSVSLSVDGPGDAELISAVRGGDVDAYGELFARHVDAARRLARQLAGPADADDLVSDAFTKVLTVLQRGGGPDLAFRAYLLTAVRRLHVDKVRAGSRLKPVDDMAPFDPGLPFHDTAIEGFDNAAAARAFASLPERWQMVLWHTEVEQQKPADIAPLLGMSANSVSALAYRAREGLRQAFLSQHATDPDDVDCAWTRDHMGAYVRGGLSRRDAARVDDHLASCRACAAVYLELTEVNSGLAGILAPLLLGTAGAGYVSSGGTGSGFLSSSVSAAKTWAAAHASVTAIGGMLVTATAVVSIYGATHLHSQDAAEVGSPPVNHSPSATSGPTSGGHRHDGKSPDSGKSTLPPASQSPSETTSSAPPSTTPTEPPSTAPTQQDSQPTAPTSEPTNPTSSPTGPTGPGGDGITFDSTPPTNPKFGDTYHVRATSASGEDVVFSVAGSSPDDACSLDHDTVTFDHAGTCVISADVTSKTGADRTGAAQDHIQQVDIPMEDQTISFAAPTGASVHGTDTLAATSSAGLPVDYTVDSSDGACRVTGTTVRYDHALDCVITASQDGNRDYHPAAAVTRSFLIDPADQIVDFTLTSTDPVVGGQATITTTAQGNSPEPVQYSSTTPGVCTISGSTVTLLHHTSTPQHPDPCTIEATQAGDHDYNAAPAVDRTLDIGKADQTVDFTLSSTHAIVGGSATITTTAQGKSGNPVRYTSTTPDVCTVSDDTVTLLHHAPGDLDPNPCTVQATQAGDDDYNAAPTVTHTLSIGRIDQVVDFTLTSNHAVVGGIATITTTAHGDSGNPVQYTATTPDVCTVSDSTVTLLHHAPGNQYANPCTIQATQDGNDDYNAATPVSHTLVIDKTDQTVDFTLTSNHPVVGSTATITTTAHGDSGNPVQYSSTTPEVCTVSGTTVALLHPTATSSHPGPCTIEASQDGDDDYNAATPVLHSVDIGKGHQVLDFTLTSNDPVVGSTATITTTSQGGSGQPVQYTSATPEVCTVSGTTVSLLHHTSTTQHPNPCTIRATQAGNDDYDPATPVSHTLDIGTATPHLDFTLPATARVGDSDPLDATSSDSTGAITYDVGKNSKFCNINPGHDAVDYHEVGTCTVTATLAPTDDYAGATVVQTVTIVGRSLSVNADVDPNPTIGALLGYHHVTVTVDGLAGETATLTASGPDGVDVVAVGRHCGTLLKPARACDVTFSPEGFDWYVNLEGSRSATVTFTATSTDGSTGSDTETMTAWPWE